MDRVTFSLWGLARKAAPPLVLAAGIGGYIALAATREQPKPREPETPTLLVETATVGERNESPPIAADGLVVPFREVTLSAQVDGRVVEKSDACRAGRVVKAGELLVRIDPADYEIKVAVLEQQRDQAQASLDELAVQVSNADASIGLANEDVALQQSEVRRIASLRAQSVSSDSAYDAARMKELGSRNALVKLQNDKRLLEAQKTRLAQSVKLTATQLEQAELDLERTTVVTPVDGVVVSANVERDGYLRKGDPVATIDDSSAAEVRTSLEMRTLALLRGELPPEVAATLGPYDPPPVNVTVTYELLGNVYAWQGTLARYDGPGIDEQTRTVPCRIRVPDPRSVSLRDGRADLPVAPPAALVRGMYVKALLHSPSTATRLVVPQRAVRPGNVVWAVRDGKLVKFDLPGLRPSRGDMLVSPQVTGLRAGDAVVVSPLPVVAEGMAVRLAAGDAASSPPAAGPAPEPAFAAPEIAPKSPVPATAAESPRPSAAIGRFPQRTVAEADASVSTEAVSQPETNANPGPEGDRR